MGKTKNKIQKIIKKSFEENMRTVGWSGMHDAPTKKIMKIIKKKLKKSKNNA